MSTTTLSLRKGNVSLIIDINGTLTQKQWDAIGGLVTALEQMERHLAHTERPDQPS